MSDGSSYLGSYSNFNSILVLWSVELFVACTVGVSLTDAAMCINLIVFVKNSDIVHYFLVIEIFYWANVTAFHMSNWKISEEG